jgi:soluble lytic murein transglycosylase-like protein
VKPADVLAIVQAQRGQWAASTIMGVIETESSFNEGAFLADRNGGSYGLMQLDLPTAKDRGYKGSALGLYDPRTNICFGVKQLDWLKATLAGHGFSGLQDVIAGYNEGVRNVLRGNPDPRYVGRVFEYREKWRLQLGDALQ